MRKRFGAFLFACLLCFTSVIYNAEAAEQFIDNVTVIHYEDGSYLSISILDISSRSTGIKSGVKRYIYTDSSGTEQWRCVLTATFTYDGTTSRATDASSTFTPANNNWQKDTLYTYRAGNTANAKLTVIQKFLGITVDTYNYTITLSCDKDGNLS